jgi:radical SAM superfamily enzyme YgiQ (UPF0313 family)
MIRLLLGSFNARYSHTNLAIRYLAAQLKKVDLPVDVTIAEWTINDQLLSILDRLNKSDSHVYAFSCYIWNSCLTRSVVRELKKIKPGAYVILGGPEASTQAEQWMQDDNSIDFVIAGEAERSMMLLVDALAGTSGPDQSKLSTVPGLYWRQNGMIRLNQKTGPIAGDDWPFPYSETDLRSCKNRILYYESSRGCPFRCSYCLSSTDRQLRERSLVRVLDELAYLISQDVRQVKLVDRTFNSHPERARQIWSFLIERYRQKAYRTRFHFEIAGDLLDDETIELLQEVPTGLFRFEIGVQSIHPAILQNIQRTCNIDRLKTQVAKLQQMGRIQLHLDLIAGLPGETLAMFAVSFNEVYALRPDMLQLGFLKILPGTPIVGTVKRTEFQWLDEPPYEVIQSDAMTFEDLCLLKRVEKLLDLYWHAGFTVRSIDWMTGFWDSPFSFYCDLSEWFDKRHLLDRSLGSEERAWRLFEFAKSQSQRIDSSQHTLFLDLLRTDFQMSGEKGQPEWMCFWEHRRDQSNQRLLRYLRMRKELFAFKKQTGQERFDRISFNWNVFQQTGRLEQGDWILAYQRTGQGLQFIDAKAVESSWLQPTSD